MSLYDNIFLFMSPLAKEDILFVPFCYVSTFFAVLMSWYRSIYHLKNTHTDTHKGTKEGITFVTHCLFFHENQKFLKEL